MAKLGSPSWISDSFVFDKNFTICEVAIDAILEKVSPPLYLYDASTIRQQVTQLQKSVASSGVKIYYSVKANTSLAILEVLRQLGVGFEVASLGELLAVQRIGVDFEKVSFAGPVKADEEIRLAIDLGIFTINAESTDELQRINKIAKEKGVRQRVGIRINPTKAVKQAGGFMGGGSQKFGIDEEMVTSGFFKQINSLTNVNLAGLHVFTATQMLRKTVFLANILNICRIAERLHRFFPLQYIDFGGGLGIPYSTKEKELPFLEIANTLPNIFQQFSFLKKNKALLFLEPGRFLVGQAGVYIVQVDHVKKSRGRQIALVNGGINHMLRPALSIGSSSHPIYNLSRRSGRMQRYDIGGPLCTSLDFLGKDVLLPETKTGDILGVFNAGAYGWSEAMPYFLSHGIPPEVFVKNNTFQLIRKAIHPREFLKNQIFGGRR